LFSDMAVVDPRLADLNKTMTVLFFQIWLIDTFC
jgi:hypothetical protein